MRAGEGEGTFEKGKNGVNSQWDVRKNQKPSQVLNIRRMPDLEIWKLTRDS